MASLVHLKLKYHNMHEEPTIISDDLSRVKRIYNALQQDQKEGEAKAMEINVAFFTRQLKYMIIQPLTSKASCLGQKRTCTWSWLILTRTTAMNFVTNKQQLCRSAVMPLSYVKFNFSLCKIKMYSNRSLKKKEFPVTKFSLSFVIVKGDNKYEVQSERSNAHHKNSGVLTQTPQVYGLYWEILIQKILKYTF